jgi:type III secretion protein Q
MKSPPAAQARRPDADLPAATLPTTTQQREWLQRLQPWQAKASRLLCNKRLARLLPPGCLISATWVEPNGQQAPQEQTLVHLHVEGAAGSGSALVPCRPGEALPQSVDPSLPADVQAMVLEMVTKSTAIWFGALGLADSQAAGAELVAAGPAARELQLELRWAMGGARNGKFVLTALDAAALRTMRHALVGRPLPLVRHRGLRLPGRFIVGQRHMPVARADALRPGDVIVPESPANADDTRGSLVFGALPARHWIAAASCRGVVITINERPRMSNGSTNGKGAPAPGESTLPINELDVPISFEIETSSLSLSELEAVEPGYVFELPAPIKGANVRLTVYGQVIGLGELVSVGDQLGVRILKIGASHAISASH